MGCCEGSDRSSKRSSSLQSRTAVTELEHHRTNYNWDGVLSFIGRQETAMSKTYGPLSLGGIALSYIRDEAKENPNDLSVLCERYAPLLVANLHISVEHCKSWL